MPMMQVFTPESEENDAFNWIKKQKWIEWEFLLSGEYSATPYHYGNLSFHLAHSKDKRFWAVLYKGTFFPVRRIVAVAEVIKSCPVEIIAGAMLRKVKDDLHLYVEYYQDINIKNYEIFREYFSGDKLIDAGNIEDYTYPGKINQKKKSGKTIVKASIPNLNNKKSLSTFFTNFKYPSRYRNIEFVQIAALLVDMKLSPNEPSEGHQIYKFFVIT